MNNPYEFAYQVDRFMRRIAAGLHEKAVAIDTERVGPFGGMVLLTLSEAQPISVSALVEQMGRDKSQMTRIIKALEEKRMIARHTSPRDGRVSYLQLTKEGRDFVEDIKKILSEVIDGILGPLSESEQNGLLAVLRKL